MFHSLNLEETPSKWRKAAQKLQDVTDLDMEEIQLRDLLPKVDAMESKLRKSSQDLHMERFRAQEHLQGKGELA